MKLSERDTFVSEHGLTLFTGALSVLSTIIGGGIVSIPYSYVSLGIPLAILLNIVVIIITSLSSNLFLACKDVLPN